MQPHSGGEPGSQKFVLWEQVAPPPLQSSSLPASGLPGVGFLISVAARNEDFTLPLQSGCGRSIVARGCTLMSFVQPASWLPAFSFQKGTVKRLARPFSKRRVVEAA